VTAACCAAFSSGWCSPVSPTAWSSANGFAVDASRIMADANKPRMEARGIKKPRLAPRGGIYPPLDNAPFGAASPVTPKFISRSDPAARWTGGDEGEEPAPTIRHGSEGAKAAPARDGLTPCDGKGSPRLHSAEISLKYYATNPFVVMAFLEAD
jgi:hypothetical protein